ncbi:hypothetical protein EHS25_003016 [Saitozyma podzolica]|uniref:RNA polymerase II-associated factor 1 n=1 Tax=Saitozyma podzolica TaxID=1890683 RepID=A0A427YCH3_9TREE|nr:hypothetical protein EHS25_003016 [Saitozyma podzolica]
MSKKSKLDLLVRVRYMNPLPPPPFPPKLFQIPSDINRLGEPSYLSHLATSAPLPMLVDSEMGMPLDLNEFEGVWDGNDQALNRLRDPSRIHDPADEILLAPFRPAAQANGVAANVPTPTEVSWMRNSNLFSRKVNNARRREAAEAAEKANAAVDASEAAQIMAIDKTFTDLHAQPVEDIQHPDGKKRALKVVETYDILPDHDVWSNAYTMVRFPERPSAATAANPSAGASSPRLAKSVLRPVIDDDLSLVEFYLPQEDALERLESAYDHPADEQIVQQIREIAEQDGKDPQLDEIIMNAHYDRIRTYELVTQERPVKELLVAFIEDEGGDEERPAKRRKGAMYKPLPMRALLRKTRARRDEESTRADVWDKARVGYRVPTHDEVAEREKENSQITDPYWANEELRRLHGGENMAEGQGEAIDDEELPMDEGAERAEDEAEKDD